MTKALMNILKILAIGVPLAILGNLCAGCDSGSTEGSSDSGLLRSDSGSPYCLVPSSTFPAQSTVSYIVSEDVAYTTSICEFEKDQKKFAITTTLSGALPTTTYVDTTGLDCSDAAHDFQGSTGLKWCFYVSTSFTPGSPISYSYGPLEPMTGRKIMALCSFSGAFLGWACE